MLKSQNLNGPSLVDALAFCIIEPAADVARLERAASARMAKVRGWVGWRIAAVRFKEETDDMVRFTVQAVPVGAGYREECSFHFIMGSVDRPSVRFQALLKACGIRDRIDDDRELVGRYFSTRDGGETARDFGPLTHALAA
ncbi:hypothetical protein MUO32_05255 [Shinella sp. CPCC 101442]|uniref:hypothetical protein n=1 Tax=Shinella sp. CPCC 101442 TaxID=2932265 RepID=UPI0021533B91|nr:hypothetical protein [Shinella sp. CPCC 101442]MCR6498433.1 hypothetical protein [Shinella sp. CPCC 101442]